MKWTNKNIVEWHKKTFPKATINSQEDKVRGEFIEMLEEAADVYIAATSGEYRFKSEMAKKAKKLLIEMFGRRHLLPAVDRKMDINVKRTFKGDHHVETIN